MVVCLEKSRVGLGVGCFSILNRTLLGEWSYCFMEEREALWKQVISRKYGVEEGGGIPVKEERVLEWGCRRRLGRKVLY